MSTADLSVALTSFCMQVRLEKRDATSERMCERERKGRVRETQMTLPHVSI